MSASLFIVCPFSSTEPFLGSVFDGRTYFLTVPGGIPDLEDPFTVETIRNLVERRGVRSVYVVNDVSCRFIDAVADARDAGIPSVGRILEEVYAASGLRLARGLTAIDLRMRLAECNVLRQVERMSGTPAMKAVLEGCGARLKGLVTWRERGLVMDLNTGIRNRVVHEH